jgi:3-hydroxyacyl-CoA dehydrogenase/enoyl-CoA hydratase/carnithine racemase
MQLSARRTFGVVGLGTIGRALAFGNWVSATRQGIPVTFLLYELDPKQRERAQTWMTRQLQKLIERGKLVGSAVERFTKDVRWVDQLEGLAPCEVVFEAIVEKLEPKQEVVARLLNDILNEDALVLCTSSGYAPFQIAEDVHEPDRVAGYHPFSPADRNLIVEVVSSVVTDRSFSADDEACSVARLFGRTPIRVTADVPCFAGNTFFTLYCLAAARLVEAGVATVAQVNAWTDNELGGSGVFGALDFTGGERGRSGTPIIMNCADLLRAYFEGSGTPTAAALFEIPAIMRDRGDRVWLDDQAGGPTEAMSADQTEIVAATMQAAVAWANDFILKAGILQHGEPDWALLSRLAFAFTRSVPEYLDDVGDERIAAVMKEGAVHVPGLQRDWNEFDHDLNYGPPAILRATHYDDPKVLVVEILRPDKRNALNSVVIAELREQLEREMGDDYLGAVLDCTVAGADVSEFAALEEDELRAYIAAGQELMAFIRGSERPIIAAVNRKSLGGGLELANACHARVIGPYAEIAFPETGIGLIPGFNGTVEAARWLDPKLVWKMIAGGGALDAFDMMRYGWAHTFTHGDPIATAAALIQDLGRGNQSLRRRRSEPIEVSDDLMDLSDGIIDPEIGSILRDVFRRGLALPLDEASELECEGVIRCSKTEAFKRGTAKFRK